MAGRFHTPRIRFTPFVIAALAGALLAPSPSAAAPPKGKDKKGKEAATKFKPETFTGLELRSIGPAVTSGRVVDIAVVPHDRATWYVAVASGGVWKTTNAGTTWTPTFDGQGSYSIGCVTLDPKNPLVVWVGSGENNSQRSVAYGDGVYKSTDGGATWENVGLKASEHIGKIVVDPRDSSIVYVAAQGPLWRPGGDRGLYKTTDGGKSWKQVLKISDDTGVSDVVLDPAHPDVLFAAAYQRRRHEWTLIDGGPESAIHKSVDGGATWKKLEAGLPKEEMGRIGLAIPPAQTDTVFAVIEAANKAGGVYRTKDAGGSWERVSEYVPNGPQYYMELFPDPKNANRLYSADTFLQVTDDGGATWKRAGEKSKHVDNHALWIDPDDTDHLLNGNDGGLYESWDRGQTWDFKANLPVTQFYKLAIDNAEPFYNVYGGTQDNYTLGGPSRTLSAHGITNADWFVAQDGDGFQPQVDPEDPNIVYAEAQHGALIRLDRKTGERIDIQPQPEGNEDGSRWNWDSPIIVSPHSHTRLYFASQRLYRSDDRGDSWKAVSPDLTRQIDRNKLKVMGRVWSVDSVAKNSSTSFYGNIVSLAESPVKEGLLYAGTDDGLVQVTEDAGKTWRKIESFPGVPDRTYVSRLTASHHAAGTVFAAFNNHKMADFKPYLLKSTDEGKSWTSIASDLPENGSVWALAEDPVDANLLFAGTEFGLFFSADGGGHWVQLKGKMPTIAVRDIALQKRENDLVAATFGRGFYVLDDYTPLRGLSAATLDRDALLFPIKKADLYVPTNWLGLKDKAFQGESFYNAANPPFGAVFTYYLKDDILTQKKVRQKAEKEAVKNAGDVFYPTWEELRTEDREEDPVVVLTVSDATGQVVRQITGPVTAGFHRVAWDLRYPPSQPASLKVPEPEEFDAPRQGPFAPPGEYTVSLSRRVNGVTTPLAGPMVAEAEAIGAATLPAADRRAVAEYSRKVARLQRAVLGAEEAAGEAQNRIALFKKAIQDTPGADPKLLDEASGLDARLKDVMIALTGDTTRSRRNEPVRPSIEGRVDQVVTGFWSTTSAPTATHKRNYEIAAAEFAPVLDALRTIIDVDLKRLDSAAESAGAPWTPGRVPVWTAE
jgi:photosystem II stability/assembly factor-like uncharacterized protein